MWGFVDFLWGQDPQRGSQFVHSWYDGKITCKHQFGHRSDRKEEKVCEIAAAVELNPRQNEPCVCLTACSDTLDPACCLDF